MTAYVLVVNAGSSSLKYSLVDAETGASPASGSVERIGEASGRLKHTTGGTSHTEQRPFPTFEEALGAAVDAFEDYGPSWTDAEVVAVGHRVVHGGLEYTAPVRVTTRTLEALRRFVPLAPLHQPHNLAPIAWWLERAPDVPQVACFDTSFHRTNPDVAQRFALPAKLYDAGVQRYGFHGLSYEYIASEAPRLDAAVAAARTIVLHLGGGSSMCAMRAGRSVATTMGFTPADGLPMGTRCGAIDPGVLVFLMDEYKMDARAIERLIYSESGLLGVSGISSDMRILLASGDPAAKLAIDLYVYGIGRQLGSLAAALGGLDAIVFTGGIGENAAVIRERVCRDAAWLGVALDAAANAHGGPRISAPGSRVSAWVVPTNEELMIARHTQRVLARG